MMKVRQVSDRVLYVLIFLVTILARLPFLSRYLYHWDSVQFVLAMDNYNVALSQPQPPGCIGYVAIGKIFNVFFNNPANALLAVSVVFSGLACVMLFILVKEMFDRKIALISCALFLTSPLFWFQGEVVFAYAVISFFVTLFAYLCFGVFKGDPRYVYLTSALLSVSGSIRSEALLLLLPLWLFHLSHAGKKRILACFSILLIVTLSWFIPNALLSGGFDQYFHTTSNQWQHVIYPQSALNWPHSFTNLTNNANLITSHIVDSVLLGLFLLLFALLLVLFRSFKKHKFSSFPPNIRFLLIWLVPSIIFYLIIPAPNSGYSLTYMPPIIILVALSLAYTSKILNKIPTFLQPNTTLFLLLLPILITNIAFFTMSNPIGGASYINHSNLYDIRRHDTIIETKISLIRQNFYPADTIIVAEEHFYYGFRHANYYLPEFKTFLPSELHDGLRLKSLYRGTEVYSGETKTIDGLVVPKETKNVVFFDDIYDDWEVWADLGHLDYYDRLYGEKLYYVLLE